jgi:hypothetical protein
LIKNETLYLKNRKIKKIERIFGTFIKMGRFGGFL